MFGHDARVDFGKGVDRDECFHSGGDFYADTIRLFMISACFEKKTGMPEAADGGAVPVHRVELAVVPDGQCGDIVENDPAVGVRFRFQVAEEHQRLLSVRMIHGDKFPQRMPKVGIEGKIPVAHHQDDIRPDSFADLLPTDPVAAENRVTEIFDVGSGMREGGVQGGLDPAAREFGSQNRGVEADNSDVTHSERCKAPWGFLMLLSGLLVLKYPALSRGSGHA